MSKGKKLVLVLTVTAVLAAAVLGVGYYVKSNYTVQNVYVEGNVHYSEE